MKKKIVGIILATLLALYAGYSSRHVWEEDEDSKTNQEQQENQKDGGESPPTIEGPSEAAIGDLCVFTLAGADSADWAITPVAAFYTDSGHRSIVFSSSVAGRYVVLAAANTGEPTILTKSFDYGSATSPDKETPTPTPAPTPETLAEWIKDSRPDDQKRREIIRQAFNEAIEGIESGTIVTADAAYASVCRTLRSESLDESIRRFLDELAERIADESTDSPTQIKTLFMKIAEAIDEGAVVEKATEVTNTSLSPPRVFGPFRRTYCPVGGCQ